jgi:hypothetical protein
VPVHEPAPGEQPGVLEQYPSWPYSAQSYSRVPLQGVDPAVQPGVESHSPLEPNDEHDE